MKKETLKDIDALIELMINMNKAFLEEKRYIPHGFAETTSALANLIEARVRIDKG